MTEAVRAVEHDREDVDAAVGMQLEALVTHVRQTERLTDSLEWTSDRITRRKRMLVVREE